MFAHESNFNFKRVLEIATAEKIDTTFNKSSGWSFYGHLWFQVEHILTRYDTLADHSNIMNEILYD